MVNTPKPPKIKMSFLGRERDEFFSRLDAYESKGNYLLEASQRGEFPIELVAFELLHSMATLYSEGFSNEAIMAHQPVSEWRQEGVLVPASLLYRLVEAWARYLDAPSGKTLGESFNLEGGGQGKKPMRAALKQALFERELAREALALYIAGGIAKPPGVAKDDVFAEVAEKYSVSKDTVKRAYKNWQEYEFAQLREAGALEEEIDLIRGITS